jgi:hypothetical protein
MWDTRFTRLCEYDSMLTKTGCGIIRLKEGDLLMRRIIISIMVITVLALVVGVSVFAAPPEGEESYDELIKRAEEAWERRDYDSTTEVVDVLIKRFPEKSEPYWRKARNIYIRYEDLPRDQKPDKATLVAAYDEIMAVSQTCMDKNPKDGCCYMWMAVGMGRKGTTEGTVSAAMTAGDMEKIMLKGIELEPEYKSKNGAANTLGDLYQMAGQYYRIVPEWACNFAVKAVIGTCGDLEKAVMYNKKAVEREPHRIEYVKELGISLVCYGQQRDKPEKTEEGLAHLKSIENLPVIKKSDIVDKDHAKLLIKNPKICCGYSRDEQQDQSKEAWVK